MILEFWFVKPESIYALPLKKLPWKDEYWNPGKSTGTNNLLILIIQYNKILFIYKLGLDKANTDWIE